ncbi:MAG: hypothetical protein EP343_02055 [Deltaproteobacteria bacterium]|nr:MAG: hypothetical protein EP343_02055 [Deltaproteobacteria bacterium]
MIRINLIGTEKKKKGKKIASDANLLELVVIILLVSLGGVGLYIWNSIEEDKLSYAKTKVNEEKRAIKGLAKAQKRFKEYEKKKKNLMTQLKVIDELRLKKQGPVRVLDEISMRIPKQVWLRSIQHKKRILLIKGVAETNEAVAIFFKSLQDSPYFKSVELQQIVRRERNENGKRVYRTVFSLACEALFSAS